MLSARYTDRIKKLQDLLKTSRMIAKGRGFFLISFLTVKKIKRKVKKCNKLTLQPGGPVILKTAYVMAGKQKLISSSQLFSEHFRIFLDSYDIILIILFYVYCEKG